MVADCFKNIRRNSGVYFLFLLFFGHSERLRKHKQEQIREILRGGEIRIPSRTR